MGEVAAGHVAGVLALADACVLVSARGRLMQGLAPGGVMVAVAAGEDVVASVVAESGGGVSIAAVNSPGSVVVSGEGSAVEGVVRRLSERGFGHLVGVVAGRSALRRESFALAKVPLCLERLREPVFAEQVWTNDLPVSGVVEHIARRCGLSLVPDTDGPLRRRVRRAWTGVRHIRL